MSGMVWASNLGVILLCLAVWCAVSLLALSGLLLGTLRAYLVERKMQKKQSTV